MLGSIPLAIRYAILALVAILTNLLAQDLTSRLVAGQVGFVISLTLGTAVGLLVKFWLDKRYIFHFRAHDIAHDTATFLLYAATGVATTLVFWGFEIAFHLLFGSVVLRYVGGALGLALGYRLKYALDKRYVFRAVSA
ncbi:GtrA family protein [Pseudoxanthomonas indica]|uniref:GtrA-like protein n=1 Tax=Pseudoxanthomonas indica TaxID=428993 RepID=A0A1T5LXX7_9GAMM|nr:GtrA family protein [Pseudoxanthomonas indica]SKC80469.1 GtrA-like protein [Pseudoxanthomonas indica]